MLAQVGELLPQDTPLSNLSCLPWFLLSSLTVRMIWEVTGSSDISGLSIRPKLQKLMRGMALRYFDFQMIYLHHFSHKLLQNPIQVPCLYEKFPNLPTERDLCLLQKWMAFIDLSRALLTSWLGLWLLIFSQASTSPPEAGIVSSRQVAPPRHQAVCSQKTWALSLWFSSLPEMCYVGEFHSSLPTFSLAAGLV